METRRRSACRGDPSIDHRFFIFNWPRWPPRLSRFQRLSVSFPFLLARLPKVESLKSASRRRIRLTTLSLRNSRPFGICEEFFPMPGTKSSSNWHREPSVTPLVGCYVSAVRRYPRKGFRAKWTWTRCFTDAELMMWNVMTKRMRGCHFYIIAVVDKLAVWWVELRTVELFIEVLVEISQLSMSVLLERLTRPRSQDHR